MLKLSLIFALLFVIAHHSYSQGSLLKSRESGHFSYIYQLTDQESFNIASKSNKIIDDSFLHSKIDSFYNDPRVTYQGKLPFGNYLFVTPSKNQLLYHIHTVQNVRFDFINDLKTVQFILRDLKGKVITNAAVEIGKGKKVSYDQQARLYSVKSAPKQKVIKVVYQGVSNFFSFEDAFETYQPYKSSGRNRHAAAEDTQPAYKGYMVFNKPRYKPLDTVKFKAYLVTAGGKPLKEKLLRADLSDGDEKGTKVLKILHPYRDGGYQFEFLLADSLDLKLDTRYNVILKEFKDNSWKEVYREGFQYEDYELKTVSFNVRSDGDVHSPGKPVSFYLSAKDENGLAVPDGRVEVVANVSRSSMYRADQVFVPDSLGKSTVILEPVGETKFVIPDSIFPRADIDFYLKFRFLNSNNESQEDSKYIKYVYKSEQIKASLKNDSLNLGYLLSGKEKVTKATMIAYHKDQEKIDSSLILLPLKLKIDPLIANYQIQTTSGYQQQVSLKEFPSDLTIQSARTKDSLRVLINNPKQIPFWYTLFSDDKVLRKGYAVNLDTLIKLSGKHIAHIRLNYIWAGESAQIETDAIYQPGMLKLEYKGPDMVYPGQQVKMELKVTGEDDLPVAFTDVTAYGITSRFKTGLVNLPAFNKQYKLRNNTAQLRVVTLETNGQLQLNWNRWGRALGLDTISYYQFTHPKELFFTAEKGRDTLTQVAPFVVRDGNIQPVHVVYIDEVPVFFSKSDQLQHYSFVVKPGKHHIRLRTADQMVSLTNAEIQKGKKTILSITGDPENSVAKVTAAPAELSIYESELLSKYMFTVQNNFFGEKTVIEAGKDVLLVQLPAVTSYKSEYLIGPLAQNYLSFKSGSIVQPFVKEPGYTYTFSRNLVKQKSNLLSSGFQSNLLKGTNQVTDRYRDEAITAGEIDSLWENYLNLRSHTTNLFNNYHVPSELNGKLSMELDTAFSKKLPYIKNIFIYKNDQPGEGSIYPGNTTYFYPFVAGTYRIMYLFKDNRYFIAPDVLIRPNGTNYMRWKERSLLPADAFSNMMDAYVKSAKLPLQRYDRVIEAKVSELFNDTFFDTALLAKKVYGKITDENKVPLPGVSIQVKGLSKSTVTNAKGEFELNTPNKGMIVVSFIGYQIREIALKSGDMGTIVLQPGNNDLNEVVVAGYPGQNLAYSTVTVQGALSGKAVGITVRGNSSLASGQKPILIVDGLPFQGQINDLKPDDILSMDVLKPQNAMAIYGSRAAAGVILVKTKKGNQVVSADRQLVAQTQTLRTRFSDYAFWQPQLITNEEGIVSWNVKFPDDITSWSARMIAMNGKKQSGITETLVRSFKSLSANFVSPQFALAGDSISVIGKLMNYTPLEEKLIRKFSYNGQELRNNTVKVKSSHIDTIPVVAQATDSLSFRYTLEQENGYFDGELRKIPVLPTGVMESKGYFDVLEKDTTVQYHFTAGLGKVTLRAESSVFPSLLNEMEKLLKYEYLCNEQLASKLKALLLEKSVRAYLNESFKHEKEIKDLIKKLQSAKRAEGTWGWWQDSREELWISLHVAEALLTAQKQGYEVVLNKEVLYRYLVDKLADGRYEDQFYAIKLIQRLNDKVDIKDWLSGTGTAGRQLPEGKLITGTRTLHQKLQLMQLQQQSGMQVDINALMNTHKKTLLGNIYWGEENSRFWDNSIQNTLLAYQILRTDGKHGTELELIRRYFLEQRKDGQWRNTYESSLILETILPDLLIKGKKPVPASILIDQTEKISVFPYTKVFETTKGITISKKGLQPVYLTAYQQYVNPRPENVSKDFTVKTFFRQNGQTVTRLKAGVTAILKAEVEVRADGDYVMIEIPIPAGCSYENKKQSYRGIESHREYFKHKASIFCTKLKAGNYTFEIELMPRYSGNYVLNPAKVELMYFPVFYGREGMKKVEVK